MEKIQIFNNEYFGEIRTVSINDKIHFVASDVAKALGYTNTSDAISRHCRWVVKHDIPHPQNPSKQLLVNVIPEGDIYRLASNSELPDAEKFESWIFDEVLPSIRKHGIYATDEMIDKMLDDPNIIYKTLTKLKAEQEKNKLLESENSQQKQLIEELKPKADYTELILQNKSVIAITQIAKDYGMSGVKFNALLHRLKVQYKIGEQWVLYADYQNKGYTHSATMTYGDGEGCYIITMWTQKGRLFLYNLLKKQGILPLIEQEELQLTLQC